jgi:hypothetical protein
MIRDLPMVACSLVGTALWLAVVGRGAVGSLIGGAGGCGRTGSGVGGMAPGWFGFQIIFLVLSCCTAFQGLALRCDGLGRSPTCIVLREWRA